MERKMTMKIRCYSELLEIDNFIDRFRYLKLKGKVGEDTFGFDRYINQALYNSPEFRKIRREVILRDNGCDLGISDREIVGKIYVHHMNPITKTDILERNDYVLNPEYLICVSHETHNAIHYGNEAMLPIDKFIVREPNDQSPWKRR
jgi:hypothetical protein